MLMALDIDANNIRSEEELKSRIADAVAKYRPKAVARKARKK